MDRKRKIIAALADLKQDIAGPIPVDIISKWQQSGKTRHDQKTILAPLERQGYLVSTDSAGLSRLTAERDLLEVLNLVSIPKEIIFNIGRQIGGRGVGIWAADNSQMFYPADRVSAGVLLDRMAAAQKVIHQQPVQVGMGIHKGKFWEIGQGMFGEEADLIEQVAENFTEGKEILISDALKEELDAKLQSGLIKREDLNSFDRSFFTLNYDELGQDFHRFKLPDPEVLADLEDKHFYPFAFSRDFFVALKQMDLRAEARERLNEYFFNRVVILVKVYHQKERLLLDQLTDWVVVNALLNEIIVKYDVDTIKSNGDVGIFVTEKNSEALEMAEEILQYMKSTDDQVSIGIARGDVLIFNLEGGGKDIAGGAVNLASKISEDVPDKNSLYVDSSVEIPKNHLHKYDKFALDRSGLKLNGHKFHG
jgi:class 3 adenylate cyclase